MSNPTRPPRPPLLGLWLAALAASLAVVALDGAEAMASHPHSGSSQPHLADLHTWTANHGIEDEEYCVLIISGSTHSHAYSSVQRALFQTGIPRWHLLTLSDGTTNTRVDIRPMPNPCTSYSSTRRAQIDYEYHVRANNSVVAACGSDNVSCVTFDRQTRAANGSHYHFDWGYVHMDADHLGSNQLINHETGHILGLMDGGPSSGTWDTSCTSSIMHLPYYGCPNNNFSRPTDNDIRSVRTVVAR